eukprot:ANDGO_04386.mRNA.1 Enhancer of rudimentary homolog
MTHTILLLQLGRQRSSRTFRDYEDVAQCIQDIVVMFEGELRRLNPNVGSLAYQISDVQNWIDSLPDMVILCFSPQRAAYDPHDKTWIKERVHTHIAQLSQRSGFRS